DVTLKMPAFEWVHVQLHQQKGMISLSPPTICNSALLTALQLFMQLKTRRKSARFRVGEPAPYPGHYNRAFAFSVLLCPHRLQCSLRFTCL
ncbi:hypothetical protein ACP8VM_27740, partial [Klebsiella pneumoniae]